MSGERATWLAKCSRNSPIYPRGHEAPVATISKSLGGASPMLLRGPYFRPHFRISLLFLKSPKMVEISIRKRPREEAVLNQRKFLRKTAKGKVIKGVWFVRYVILHDSIHDLLVIRERYLRDDVACGIEGCILCNSTTATPLSATGDTGHKLFPIGHYVIPDTNVFLHQVRALSG